jgi:C4-type Zn-finger protein
LKGDKKMSKVKKTNAGICPKCGEENGVEYIDHDFCGDYLIHLCYCNNCGTHFREFEALQYTGYEYTDENGQDHEFNEEGEEI